MKLSDPHSMTMALIRKRDGEVLLVRATRKNPSNGIRVEYWDLLTTEDKRNERADQAAFRMAADIGFHVIESIEVLGTADIVHKASKISQNRSYTLVMCDVDERNLGKLPQGYTWSSLFIASKLLEEAAIPPAFLGKILELGMYTSHTKPTFDFMEDVKHVDESRKKNKEIAPKFGL